MKRSIFTSFLIVIAACASAYDFKCGELCYSVINDSTVKITKDSIPYGQSHIIIPSSVIHNGKAYAVRVIGTGAFSFCENVEEIKMPNSITLIESMAFFLCRSSIKSLIIPNSVRKIEHDAFGGALVENIYIGNGIEEIGWNFSNASSLRNITITATNPPIYRRDGYFLSNDICNTLYVPKESLYKYAKAEGWKEFGRILPIDGDGSVGVFKPDFDPKNKVKGVAGCSFGCDSKQAINHFNNKFGYYAISNSYETTYADVYFAGYYFDIMELQFVDNKPKQRKDFASIEFQKIFDANDYEAAKRCFESIRKMYSEKYSNEREYEEGWCMYGMIEEDYHNTVPPIILGIEKGIGGDGIERYYIMIYYYGFRTSDRYSDDI